MIPAVAACPCVAADAAGPLVGLRGCATPASIGCGGEGVQSLGGPGELFCPEGHARQPSRSDFTTLLDRLCSGLLDIGLCRLPYRLGGRMVHRSRSSTGTPMQRSVPITASTPDARGRRHRDGRRSGTASRASGGRCVKSSLETKLGDGGRGMIWRTPGFLSQEKFGTSRGPAAHLNRAQAVQAVAVHPGSGLVPGIVPTPASSSDARVAGTELSS